MDNIQKITTLECLRKLLMSSGWQHEQNINIKQRQVFTSVPPLYKNIGHAQNISTLRNIKIIYTEKFSFFQHDRNSLQTSSKKENGDVLYRPIIIECIELTDDIDLNEICQLLPEDFKKIDYSSVLPETGTLNPLHII